MVVDLQLPKSVDFATITGHDDYLAHLDSNARAELVESFENDWDGTIQLVRSPKIKQRMFRAGGIADDQTATTLADVVSRFIRRNGHPPMPESPDPLSFVHLGPDRWIPRLGREDARQTYSTLPDELPSNLRDFIYQWVGSHLDRANRELRQWPLDLMTARRQGKMGPPEPIPPVPNVPLLDELLPYLVPIRTDLEQGEVIFKSRGQEVTFSSLSSGEKDLVARSPLVDAASGDRSIILFDEPELHINPDLVRTRLAVLKRNVQGGQIFIATHSFEAVEAAGEANTFVLRRSDPTGPVDLAEPWDEDRTFVSLATSLGVPAFSFAGRRFIFIEGEGKPDKTNRFDTFGGDDPTNRFIGMGGWAAVLEHLTKVARFAGAADRYRQLRLGAVIDRDFLDDVAVEALSSSNVHVLACRHEENIFLQPDAVLEVMRQLGDSRAYEELIREVADDHAGRWIFLHANERMPETLRELFDSKPMTTKNAIKWARIVTDQNEWITSVVAAQTLSGDHAKELSTIILDSVRAYEEVRLANDLWKWCYGKQAFGALSSKLGLERAVFERAVTQLWTSEAVPWPEPVRLLRDWLHGLQPMSTK